EGYRLSPKPASGRAARYLWHAGLRQKKTIAKEGFRGLYKGMLAPLAGFYAMVDSRFCGGAALSLVQQEGSSPCLVRARSCRSCQHAWPEQCLCSTWQSLWHYNKRLQNFLITLADVTKVFEPLLKRSNCAKASVEFSATNNSSSNRRRQKKDLQCNFSTQGRQFALANSCSARNIVQCLPQSAFYRVGKNYSGNNRCQPSSRPASVTGAVRAAVCKPEFVASLRVLQRRRNPTNQSKSFCCHQKRHIDNVQPPSPTIRLVESTQPTRESRQLQQESIVHANELTALSGDVKQVENWPLAICRGSSASECWNRKVKIDHIHVETVSSVDVMFATAQ
uniref:ADP/ATP translocase n=1 Tax=Macrostomum lignano TaxID=282301 RepID=A0A1I8JR93_9PLAT